MKQQFYSRYLFDIGVTYDSLYHPARRVVLIGLTSTITTETIVAMSNE